MIINKSEENSEEKIKSLCSPYTPTVILPIPCGYFMCIIFVAVFGFL